MRAWDPERMRLTRSGRVIWTDPPAGEKRGAFVRGGVSGAPVSGTREDAAPSSSPEVAAPSPSSSSPEVAAPSPSSSRAVEGLRSELGPPPPPPIGAAVPEVAPEVEGLGGEAGAEAAPWVPSPAEVRGFALIHEGLVNRISPFPRPYSAQEQADVGEACGVLLGRYGQGMREHAPLIAFGTVTIAVAAERRSYACAGCGNKRNPDGARFCVGCGSRLAAGGPCVASCGVEMPAGTAFCPGCGAGQVAGG